MQVNPQKIVAKKAKRRGRGYGSGKGGHTVGFGQKGQKSRGRGKVRPGMEGGNVPLFRKLPKQHGNKSLAEPVAAVTTLWLNSRTKNGQLVDKKFLISEKVISKPSTKAKVIGKDAIDHKLTIKGISVSAGAREVIEKAGGVVLD